MIKRAFINMCSTFIDFLLLLGEVLDLGDNFFFLNLKFPIFIRLIIFTLVSIPIACPL